MIRIAYIRTDGISQSAYRQLLDAATAQRQEKAKRYRCFEDSIRCVTADALLRWAVSQTPGLSLPYSLEYDAKGKPRLTGAENFHFNLSHSGKWVVIAWGDSPVGVDVEAIRESGGMETIARRHFTEAEYRHIFSGETIRPERFFQIWTGKESYLKYLGTGLTKALSSFSAIAPTVEDPPGTPLSSLYLHSFRLEDACLSLCCQAQKVQLTELAVADIISGN